MKRLQIAPIIKNINKFFVRFSTSILGDRARAYSLASLVEEITPITKTLTKYGVLHYFCPAVWPYSRSDMQKEPGTYEWIDSFSEGDIFYDIGANIGVFSLYAAIKGHKIYSFEPAAINYSVLTKNIELNRLDKVVTALNIAIHSSSTLNYLNMNDTSVGAAQHTFGDAQELTFRQAVLSYSVDEFIALPNVKFPNHIKIDVDGNEPKILEGATSTLSDSRLKSVSIEIDKEGRNKEFIQNIMNINAFVLSDTKNNYVYRKV